MLLISNGSLGLDRDGEKIFKGSEVEMPLPNMTDNWLYGGFSAIVMGIRYKTGNLMVKDADDDVFEIEIGRVIVLE